MCESFEPDWEGVRSLCKERGLAISLYLGAHRAGSGTQPGAKRLEGMLTQIAQLLANRGLSPDNREALLAPLLGLLAEPGFQKGSRGGTAIFRSTRLFRIMPLSIEPSEDSWSVEDRFFVRPLLAELSPRARFDLLALSERNVRLLAVDPQDVRALALPPEFPVSLEEFGGFDKPDHQQTNRAPAGPAAGGRAVAFRTSSESDARHRHLHDFFMAVDRALDSILSLSGTPLMLAGTERETAAYRAINKYAKCVDAAVLASPDGGATDRELAARARERIADWLSPEELHAVAQYASGATSVETGEILRAAAAGRVLHLFVAGDRRQPGEARAFTGGRRYSGEIRTEEDPINAAVVETLGAGGQVWTLPPGAEVDSATLAAVFRY